MADRLDALADRAEIEDVIRRYARGIDRRDFDLVRACYHPDATDDHGSFRGSVDEYVDWVEGLTAKYSMTMHLIAGVLIDLAGDVAAAETTGVAVHRSDDPAPHLNLATGFRYLDRFERRDGRWAIAARQALGEWSIAIPADTWWPIPDTHRQGRPDGLDPLYALLGSLPTAP